MTDKVDHVGLYVFVVNLERSDTHSVVNSDILKAVDFLTALADESEELEVYLDVMSWHLFVVRLVWTLRIRASRGC